MIIRLAFLLICTVTASELALAQNTNSSTSTPGRPRSTTQTPKSATPPTSTEKPAVSNTAPKTAAKKPVVNTQQSSVADGVVAAFNKLMDGIRHANIDAVTDVYWNSSGLSMFNYNGSVTKGWQQVRENRKSSYPEIKDVKLETKDLSVTMLGPNAALVTCLWTQSQNYKGNPETASGRMTLVFKKYGTAWKAIHLHSSPDSPNPAVVPPSEQLPKASPSPTP